MCGVCGCGEQDDAAFDQHHHTDILTIQKNLFDENNQYALKNQQFFNAHNISTFNLLSSPGSGKTTLLVETINALKQQNTIAVIEGDQQTSEDADKIKTTGVNVKQINTGQGCHLDAHMIDHAVEDLSLKNNSFLFIENVGNLVCPALFHLGEKAKVVILSVTEGDNKPIKYPDMFERADLVLINKIDLLPYVDFDLKQCQRYLTQINPNAKSLTLSAKTKEGMQDWINWLLAQHELTLAFS